MVTFEINKLLSFKSEIRMLNNGSGTVLSRIRVVLKSLQSRFRSGSFISVYGDGEFFGQSNQLRAPPIKAHIKYFSFNCKHC